MILHLILAHRHTFCVWSMHCLVCVKRPGFGNGFYAIYAAVAPKETSKTYTEVKNTLKKKTSD